ncbi:MULTISPECIES: SHOCT domain-containing protein [unclassified Streptomyces]|uniref:SHOCT domain-containing protein n=1 Tax=unclassified Streptomyces TaxID=2593676 RepID=UPI002DD8A874|nr:SHOCT domain-containing protein [Streptomyces sp. NBC_01750]WSB01896.1 SHOCT domain-containing protein [Streptomyces sp. NBC_01794]WSD33834.1 SHOCT domain-containing protein [Streptomyces sp. NBC_01750]
MDGDLVLAYDYPVLGAFWTVMWIFLWIMWLMLLFRIIIDIFRDHEMSGWAKTAWLIFVLIIPFLGVLVYVIVRGKEMGTRELHHAQEQRSAMDSYIRETAGGAGSGVDQLAKLSELKAKGDISEAEFQQAKEKLLH